MDNFTIVESNELVDACYSLNITEVRVLNLAMAKVNSKESSTGPINIHIADYKEAYGIVSNNAYEDIKKAVKSIMRKPIVLIDYENNETVELSWLSMNKYNTSGNGSHIVIEFSEKIEPYLFVLKERFTALDFKYASRLDTPFSFRLYQWLKKYQNLDRHNKNGVITVVFDIESMKKHILFTGEFLWSSFSRYKIQPAVDKINQYTDISVIYKPVKQGRKVVSVEFSYVLEKDISCIRPIRPRLYRRPKVKSGSHEEGAWMRKNLSILLDYEKALKSYDNNEKLTLSDLRKMQAYASIYDKNTELRIRNEIDNRNK